MPGTRAPQVCRDRPNRSDAGHLRWCRPQVRTPCHLDAAQADIRDDDPTTRQAVRQDRSAPIFARIDDWLALVRACASLEARFGISLACISKDDEGPCRFLSDRRVEIDNNAIDRNMHPVALNRKNAICTGHSAAADNRVVIALRVEICNMNGADPQELLSAILTSARRDHAQSHVDEPFPWNCTINARARESAGGAFCCDGSDDAVADISTFPPVADGRGASALP